AREASEWCRPRAHHGPAGSPSNRQTDPSKAPANATPVTAPTYTPGFPHTITERVSITQEAYAACPVDKVRAMRKMDSEHTDPIQRTHPQATNDRLLKTLFIYALLGP